MTDLLRQAQCHLLQPLLHVPVLRTVAGAATRRRHLRRSPTLSTIRAGQRCDLLHTGNPEHVGVIPCRRNNCRMRRAPAHTPSPRPPPSLKPYSLESTRRSLSVSTSPTPPSAPAGPRTVPASLCGGCASPPRVGGKTPADEVGQCHHHAPLSALLLSAVHPVTLYTLTQPSTAPLQAASSVRLTTISYGAFR